MALGYTAAFFVTSVLLYMANEVPRALAAHHWLYLEEVVEQYIMKINKALKGQVITWGLTANYTYWKNHSPPGKHPVKAKVGSSKYSKCNGIGYLKPQETDCTAFFHWYVNEGINSPFSLSVNAIVPEAYDGLTPRPIVFNMNGLTKMSADQRWGYPTAQVARKLVKVCQFSANINFDGDFVYALSNPDEGNFKWVLVNITELAHADRSLEVRRGKLRYVAKGMYTENIFCNGNEKQSRVKPETLHS